VCCYGDCHYGEFHLAECHYAKYHNPECHFDYHNAECHNHACCMLRVAMLKFVMAIVLFSCVF
jgi:hypothetical protein